MQSKACVVSTFDMVNIADLDLLRQAMVDDRPVAVGVLGDQLVTQLHGRGPVVGQDERLELVRSLRVTQEVFLCNDLNDLIERDWWLLTDEGALAELADELIEPARRSASPELLNALAHGRGDV